jgi:hypothetical protein
LKVVLNTINQTKPTGDGGSYCSGAMAMQLLSMSFYSYCKNHPIRTCYILDSFWFDVFGIVVGKKYNQKFYNHKAWCYLVREWTIKELCTSTFSNLYVKHKLEMAKWWKCFWYISWEMKD